MFPLGASWLLLTASLAPLQAPPERAVPRYALLVGCTDYQNAPIASLRGPVNDVRLWRATLTDPAGFAFPTGQVRELVGWPDNKDDQPTRTNILRELDRLEKQAQPGARIFILLAGHGTQQPIPDEQEPLDPTNPEPDGLDEVFLPADFLPAVENRFPGAILDQDIGARLERMRQAGAEVWVVFECCHSGSMTRGKAPAIGAESGRGIDPELLGVKADALDQARQRAALAVKKTPAVAVTPKVRSDPKQPGRLIAFYAAQAHERAVETLFPSDAALDAKNIYGVLSHCVWESLAKQRPLTYRDLMTQTASRVRGLFGAERPHPYAEGDLDQPIFGQAEAAPVGALLRRQGTALHATQGRLHGLTPGSILAVTTPGETTARGYVRVESAELTEAQLAPVAYETRPAAKTDELPDRSLLTLVRHEVSLNKIRILTPPATQALLGKLPEALRQRLQIVEEKPDEPKPEAPWELRIVSDVLLLLASHKPSAGPRRPLASYPVAEEKRLLENLALDLERLVRWQTLWQIAAEMSPAPTVEVEVRRRRDSTDRVGLALDVPILHAGEPFAFHFRNTGKTDVWVCVLSLEADLQIRHLFTTTLGANKALEPLRGTTPANTNHFGPEGLIVLVWPVAALPAAPDFKFLEQGRLQAAVPVQRGNPALTTPFDKLLAGALLQRPGPVMRGSTSNPSVVLRSWTLEPARPAP